MYVYACISVHIGMSIYIPYYPMRVCVSVYIEAYVYIERGY